MKALAAVLVLACTAGAPAWGACSYPRAPEKIPDGATAALEDMLAAQKAIKTYNDEIKAYTDCLKLEHDTTMTQGSETLTPEQKADMERMQVQKNNAAVDEAEAVTARFNEQVKIFRARTDTKKNSKKS